MAPFATPLAATNDPVFGPSHSAYLRLYSYMVLKGHLDTSWTDVKPQWKGHNEQDILPFRNLMGDRESNKEKYYTNSELLDMMNPSNPDLSYIYSNFDWNHCPQP
ncbi:unnamed protein product [Discosporangium mesarthrocarpum]